MISSTIGRLLVNDALPPDMRSESHRLDKAGIQKLFTELAEKHPDQYRETAKKLSDIGHSVATETGGYSFGLKDLQTSDATKKTRQLLERDLSKIYADRNMSNDERDGAVLKTVSKYQGPLQDSVLAEAKASNNPLARQVVSGARGNKVFLNSLLGHDGLYVDHRDHAIPLAVTRNYSEGLTPSQYFSGSFGTRKGLVDLKMCLDADTLVLMADYGEKRIADIVIGDRVLGTDAVGRTRPVRVTNVFDNGLRSCKRWRFRVGACLHRFVELVATPEHKVLSQIKDGRPESTYAYRSDYTPGLRPLASARLQKNPRKNSFVAWPHRGGENTRGRSEPRALLLGLLLGDGHLPRSVQWSLSCGDPLLIEDIRQYLAGFNIVPSPPNDGYSYGLRNIEPVRQQRNAAGGYGETGNPTKLWIKELGLFGKKSHEKFIPDEVWTWNDAAVADLLAGLYSTDGCLDIKGRCCNIKFSSTSEQMARTLQKLLEARFGIWTSKMRRVLVENIPLGNYDQFHFAFAHPESVRKFASLVRLVGERRRVLAEALPQLSNQPRSKEIGFKIVDAVDVGQRRTFDIEVNSPEHMFVLANGLIVSNSTGDSGYLSKQLNQINHRLVVSDTDDDAPVDADAKRGLPVTTKDPDNEGALLAHPAGKYSRNTLLTPRVLQDLQAAGHDRILVRSPTVGGPKDGGIYSMDAGFREKGRLAPIGDYIGLSAAQSIAEPITQSSISSKHSGGVLGASAGAIGGFKYINAMIQNPKVFPGGAAHAQTDGRVDDIKEAPQGGQYVTVGSHEHYLHPDTPAKVKLGDTVEAGDVLSEGIPSPGEIVQHKGIGEGRKYFTDSFHKVLKDSGINAHRRNVELLARGLINHVELTDEMGDWSPGDTVPYHLVERNYQPRPGHQVVPPKQAVGKYLEKPVLHHSIGTRITPSMVKDMQHFGVPRLTVHPEPPGFKPVLIRGMAHASHDLDWGAQQLGSYQKGSLLAASHRGAVSDEGGTSYVPALMRSIDFGRVGPTQGWTAEP